MEKFDPHRTSLQFITLDILTGILVLTVEEVTAPFPSCPLLFLPQEYNSPETVTPRAWNCPEEMLFQVTFGETGRGTNVFVVFPNPN